MKKCVYNLSKHLFTNVGSIALNDIYSFFSKKKITFLNRVCLVSTLQDLIKKNHCEFFREKIKMQFIV